MEYQFRFNKQIVRLTREQVIEALRDVKPARMRTHGVVIGGVLYPVRQALAIATGLDNADIGTQTARRAFLRLGFRLEGRPRPRPNPDTGDRPSLKPANKTDAMFGMGTELLAVAIHLNWWWWEWWDDIERDDMTGEGVLLPYVPGVYEVIVHGEEQRLYIGRASNLAMRVKYGLVKGTSEHYAGRLIRANEDLTRVCVRWADTDRPAAAEEELHRRHRERFGALPKYTRRT